MRKQRLDMRASEEFLQQLDFIVQNSLGIGSRSALIVQLVEQKYFELSNTLNHRNCATHRHQQSAQHLA